MPKPLDAHAIEKTSGNYVSSILSKLESAGGEAAAYLARHRPPGDTAEVRPAQTIDTEALGVCPGHGEVVRIPAW